MYGYLDESGSPGKAIDDNNYLSLSLVIFDSEIAIEKAEKSVEDLKSKLKLPLDYEFHCSRNNPHVQRNFIQLLSLLDFKFITIAIRKNDYTKTASYSKLSKLLISELRDHSSTIKIEMDSNPTLYHNLKKIIREQNLKTIKLRQGKSHSNSLLQIAEYVANLSSRKLKGVNFSHKGYSFISRKMLTLIEIDMNSTQKSRRHPVESLLRDDLHRIFISMPQR